MALNAAVSGASDADVAGAGGAAGQSDRRDALIRAEGFRQLPTAALELLAAASSIEPYAAGDVIIAEGDAADQVYVVLEGAADVVAAGPEGSVELAVLTAGDIVGEIAALDEALTRQATVRALSPMQVLALPSALFREQAQAYPEARAVFESLARRRLLAKFLRTVAPLAAISRDRLDALAARVELVTVSTGDVLFRQGETGEVCYLVRSGRFEVLLEDVTAPPGTEPRLLATLYPSSLVGEVALLTGAPRNATVRALDAGELVLLRRADFLELLASNRQATAAVMQQWRLRDRPRQQSDVTASEMPDASGETATILKHRRTGAYYRLSPSGRFIWDRLDGRHTLRDLMMEYWAEHKLFAPQIIAEVVGGLTAAGFVEATALDHDVAAQIVRLSPTERALQVVGRLLEYQVPLAHPDALVGRVYDAGGYLFCRPLGIAVLVAVAIAGGIVFLVGGDEARTSVGLPLSVVLWLVPVRLLTVTLHELGHALATRAAGCEVRAAGLGLYWLMPIAYVDTSDVWLASRRARIMVSLAGTISDLAVGGLAALLTLVAANPTVASVLAQIALLSYGSLLVNLCPALKFDGYYLLSDLLDRPNLRRRAFAFLARDLGSALGSPAVLWEHRLDLTYALGSLLYLALVVPAMAWAVQGYVDPWTVGRVPESMRAAIAWLLPVALVAVVILGVIGEMRAARNGESAR